MEALVSWLALVDELCQLDKGVDDTEQELRLVAWSLFYSST